MTRQRHLSLDVFRGLAIALMVFGNTALIFKNAGAWANHAVDFGLTPADVVAPMFIFGIAATYRASFQKSITIHGRLETYVRFFRRYASVMGLGFLFHPIFPASNQGILFGWGVLASIGIAGLLTLTVIHTPRRIRLALALLLLAFYQYGLTIEIPTVAGPMSMADLNLKDRHGGLFGGIGWFAMMLLGTVGMSDFREQRAGRVFWFGCICVLAGFTLHLVWQTTDILPYAGISKERVTPAYVLVTTGLSAWFFWACWYLYDVRIITGSTSRFFQPISRNAILLFILHPFLIIASYLILGADAGNIPVHIAAVVNTLLMWRFAVWLDERNHYVVL